MLSTIGLVLDAVGAISLVLGLFRTPPVGLYGGDTKPSQKDIAAEDRAYGTVGGLFLFSGFVLQLVGVGHKSPSTCAKIVAALVTALVAVTAAVLMFLTARRMFRRRLD